MRKPSEISILLFPTLDPYATDFQPTRETLDWADARDRLVSNRGGA